MTIYMLTMPRTTQNKVLFKKFIENNDIHKWVIGYETGRTGYEHFQCRIQFAGDFSKIKNGFPDAHILEASDDWGYETKEGHFVSSDDNAAVLSCRYGILRDYQQQILNILDGQSDRGILVWYDKVGGIGKSYLTRWLHERRLAYYVPPTIRDPKSIIQYVCAGYQHQKYIVIDIPRSAQWDESLYTAIETIKDGLIYDTRYTARVRDIWGAGVLVLTNTIPKLDALSIDRWDIREGKELTKIKARLPNKKKSKTKKLEVDSLT